jgi:hypothetical protein
MSLEKKDLSTLVELGFHFCLRQILLLSAKFLVKQCYHV